jgi:hypothetical protein
VLAHQLLDFLLTYKFLPHTQLYACGYQGAFEGIVRALVDGPTNANLDNVAFRHESSQGTYSSSTSSSYPPFRPPSVAVPVAFVPPSSLGDADDEPFSLAAAAAEEEEEAGSSPQGLYNKQDHDHERSSFSMSLMSSL